LNCPILRSPKTANKAGLLSPAGLGSLIEAQLRRRKVDEFFAIADLLAADAPPMSDEEIAAEVGTEIHAARAEKRARQRRNELETSLSVTEERLRVFEAQYCMTTAEFVTRYADDQIQETLETIEWLGEYRMARLLQQKLDVLTTQSSLR
jgi:hypothetical protein